MENNSSSNKARRSATDPEASRLRRLRQLGSDNPVCVTCGENHLNTLELHHVGGRAYDSTTVILCRNCHRKLSDASDNAAMPDDPPRLECLGHLLIGLAQFLILLAERLMAYGRELLDSVGLCPAPLGSVTR